MGGLLRWVIVGRLKGQLGHASENTREGGDSKWEGKKVKKKGAEGELVLI